jgi:hypothetical protein
MGRNDFINELLDPVKSPIPPAKVNDVAKRIINWIFGRGIFTVHKARLDQFDLYKSYNSVFDLEKDKTREVLYDLAEQSGFFRVNTKMDAVQEGKRALFLYILGKITKEPINVQNK